MSKSVLTKETKVIVAAVEMIMFVLPCYVIVKEIRIAFFIHKADKYA